MLNRQQTHQKSSNQSKLKPDNANPSPHLTSLLGNQAMLNLLQAESTPSIEQVANTQDLIQTNRRKNQKKKNQKKRKKQRQNATARQQAQPAPAPAKKNSWLDWFASWTGGEYEAAEEEDYELEDDPNIKDWEQEGALLDYFEGEESEEEEQEGAFEFSENPFKIEELEIDLGDLANLGSYKGDSALGEMSATAKRSLTYGGKSTVAGGAKVEGQYGQGEGQGKLETSSQGFDADGKASFLLGAAHESKSGTLSYKVGQHQLAGSGQMEGKLGLSADLALKLAYTAEKMGGEGKMAAFLGAATEGKTKIMIKSGGKDLFTTEGKLGMSFGLGGELSGRISWEGGVLNFAHDGKLSMGIGYSYGYSVSIDVNQLMALTGSSAASTTSFFWRLLGY
ncbi:hypothetical protein MASR2M15_28620 [Anaerolineales bacterium]